MTVFIAVLLIVLFITLADPVIRLIRLELRYKGKQEEKILEAKTNALEDGQIQAAMAERADWEAGQLADRILGAAALPVKQGPGFTTATAIDHRSRPRGESPKAHSDQD